MTLEDFFTLTEMKDGLTSPARVKELVDVMQKEKNCVVRNNSDATRQWSTVASTIASTENRDCLDFFIQLDGLSFIGRWLKDAQDIGNDTGDGFAAESILALLRALEKLHIDNDMSISSGITVTVKNLLGHNSSIVQDQARAVFESWTKCVGNDKVAQAVEEVDKSLDAASAESAWFTEGSVMHQSSILGVCHSEQSSAAEIHAVKAASDDILPSCSNDFNRKRTEDAQNLESNDLVNSHVKLDPAQVENGPSVHSGSPVVLNSAEDKFLTVKESPTRPMVGTVFNETCSSPLPKPDNREEKSEFAKPNEVTNDAKHTSGTKNSENELIATVTSSASNKLDPLLSAHAADALDSMMDSDLHNKLDNKDGDSCTRAFSHDDVNVLVPEPNRDRNDGRSTRVLDTTDQLIECCSSVLQEAVSNECVSGKIEDPDSSSSSMEYIEAVDTFMEQAGGRGGNFINASYCFEPSKDTNDCGLADMELEYGLVDALEVARKVAKEVAQDAVHYKDSFCSSSSDKSSGGSRGQPGSPDSINGKEEQFTKGPPVEAPSRPNLFSKASPKEWEEFIESENLEAKPEKCTQDMESSQVTEAAEEPEVNADKGFCDFDLNLEVCSEDVDHSVNPTTAMVSVVSASRPAVASGLPVAPLQFEGTLGWKGSAATSAFRPASPRRILDGDRPLSVEDGSSCSKQRQDFLDIDLNVAGGADNEMSSSVAPKQTFAFRGLSSGESSVEVSPRRSERLNLDLNRVDDEVDALPSDRRAEGQLFFHQNGHQSPSPASSWSSIRPTVRNIDLNDPSFYKDSSSNCRSLLGKPVYESVNARGATKADDPVISVMGMRLEVSRKELAPQIFSPLQNGTVADPAIHTSLGRMGNVLGLDHSTPHANPPVYGFNGLVAGPSISYSPAMYGPSGSIPCMVDSRGKPVVPQIVTSAAAVLPSYSQPPFFMNLTGPPVGLNGVGGGPLRPSFGLNSGSVTGGSRDSRELRQLFGHNENRLVMDERIRANPQASLSLGIGEKRREPETSWELYPFGNKLQRPPAWR